MKTIFSILFLFVCAFAHAQYHNVEGIRVVGRSDSTTISNVGQIQFDADDDKFRFNDGTGWFSFLKEGASLPYLPLITGGNNFDVEGTGTLRFGNPDFLDGAASGIWLEIGNDGLFGDYVSVKSDIGEIVNISAFNGGTVTITGTIDATAIKEGGVDIIDKTYVDEHLGGLTIPAGSTATQNQLIRKGSTNFEYFTPSGSGITYSSGSFNVTGNVSVPIQWTWNNIGTRPYFTVGVSGGAVFDSVSMYTGAKGFLFQSEGISENNSITLKGGQGFVYNGGASPATAHLMYYAADYSGSSHFTDRALVDKGYVNGLISNKFWPLTGTASLTGGTIINGGGGNHDLFLGSSGSRLDDLWVYADNQALIDVASGNNVNRVTLQPGFSSFALLDTDGETLDVEILVQPGAADILRIVKDESVTVFEINADGSIVYGAPPTDCDGLATNTIWNDNGTLKLCP
jgi:hypothetical protein